MALTNGDLPAHRFRFATRDEAEAEQFIRRMYVGNRARFGTVHDDARFTVSVAETSCISASFLRSGIDYFAALEPFDYFCPISISHGRVRVRHGRDETIVLPGEQFLYPLETQAEVEAFDVGTYVLQLPASQLAAVAEETAGIAGADLRWEAVTPVSAAAARRWSAFMDLACDLLLAEGSPAASPLVARELTRTAAVTALHTFPNTAMTVSYQAGPGWAAPAAVRRAAAFIEAHAGQPLAVGQIADVAGVSSRALQDSFRRYYGTNATGYLRRVRLERARAELLAADPATGLTVASVARRWGWASPSGFAAVYQERFGQAPSRALRQR